MLFLKKIMIFIVFVCSIQSMFSMNKIVKKSAKCGKTTVNSLLKKPSHKQWPQKTTKTSFGTLRLNANKFKTYAIGTLCATSLGAAGYMFADTKEQKENLTVTTQIQEEPTENGILPQDQSLNSQESTTPSITPKDIVLAFDADDVLSEKNSADTLSIVQLLFNNPKVFALVAQHPTLLLIYKEIKAKAKEILKGNKELSIAPTAGTSNIMYKLMQWLEDEKGYENMVGWTDVLTAVATNPTPKKEVLETIKKLKGQGFTIVFATNQDNVQHKKYQEKMRALGYDFDELFDGGVTTAAYTLQECSQKNADNPCCSKLEHNNKETWHVTPHMKPEAHYFKALANLSHSLKPGCRVIFTDDKQENTAQAIEQGMTGIHFTSVEQFKKDLERQGFKL